ncbi:MAG: hypothetical protein ASARMPREDX12_004233 [Alectoria sarmentosa]|nr:MAG: hypothetical protein ASARMPREDX12_004233 [Alectoria sarmentosa]
MYSLPKPAPHLTEAPIPYTSILRAANLQMSLHRTNTGPKSNTDSIMRCEMDFEADNLDDGGTATVNRYLQQAAPLPPPPPPTTTYLSLRTKSASNATTTTTASRSAAESSKHHSDRRANATALADHPPICICQTCERAATEAKAAALPHR